MNKIQLNNFTKTKYFDAFKLIISHQKVKESRHDRKFEDDFLNNRNENVDVAAINLDFDKKIKTVKLSMDMNSYLIMSNQKQIR